MNKKILEVHNLSVNYGKEAILNNLSFTVNEHEVLTILGPNGAGKSTLFKALLSIIPYSGSIEWHTKNIGYLPAQETIIRQNLPPLTVKDFFFLKTISLEIIKQNLHDVGLSDSLLQQQFATLSTGQFQRMMLAWVLVDNPSVLLLDEPTSGIDIGGEETVYSLLHHLWQKRNLTILLITHNISIVWKHATNVLCLNKKLLCYGTPEQTLNTEVLKKIYGTEVSLYEHRHPSFE